MVGLMENSWRILGNELSERLTRPIGQVSFVFYFVLATFLAAIGVWLAVGETLLANGVVNTIETNEKTSSVTSHEPIFTALLTYFPAMGSLACLQVIVMEDEKKYLRSFYFFLLIFSVVLAILAGGAFTLGKMTFAWIITSFGTFTALLSYWIAISREDRLMDNTTRTGPLGGSATDALAGNTEGFQV